MGSPGPEDSPPLLGWVIRALNTMEHPRYSPPTPVMLLGRIVSFTRVAFKTITSGWGEGEFLTSSFPLLIYTRVSLNTKLMRVLYWPNLVNFSEEIF